MAIIENNITKSLMRPLRMNNTIMPKINQEIPKVKGGAYENESGQTRQDKDGRHRQTHRRSPLLGEPQMTLPNACAGSRRMESTKQPRISARLCFYAPYSFRRRFYLVRQRPKSRSGRPSGAVLSAAAFPVFAVPPGRGVDHSPAAENFCSSTAAYFSRYTLMTLITLSYSSCVL